MTIDNFNSSEWTGRHPQFPKYEISIACPLFSIMVGRLINVDGYGAAISWGRNKPRGIGDSFFRHSRMWVWMTAEQVFANG